MYYMCSVRKKLSSFPGKLELERKSTGERVKSEDFLDCSESVSEATVVGALISENTGANLNLL